MITCLHTHRRCDSKGYSLVELLVAMTLSAVLVIIVFQIIMQAQSMADLLDQRIRFNQEARNLFEMVANGGFSDMNANNSINPVYPDERVPGVRSGTGYAGNQLYRYTSYQWDETNNIYSSIQVAGRTVLNRFNLYCERGTILANSTPRLQSSIVGQLVCTGAGSPSLDCPNGSTQNIGMLYNGRLNTGTVTTLYPIYETPYGGNARFIQTRFELADPDTITSRYSTDISKEVTVPFFNLPWVEKEYYRSSFFMMEDY
ncbi:MAG: prepilin-type N-terminal cleavage/methylation domain-containing protein [Magnetococcales bacterium]|nr:prepilin-type N-terminal cleavage/methylation domain-containing protein [Magnetococcales bacterium]